MITVLTTLLQRRLVNNILFCYEGDKHTGNESEKKQHKEKHSSSMEAYTDGSKSTRRKIGYAAVFTDFTRRGHFQKKLPFTQLK